MASRIHEELAIIPVKAPASIATATATKSSYVASAAQAEIEFVWTMASLANGKKMTVKIYGATASDGTGATAVSTSEFTATADTTNATASISVKVPSDGYAYYCAELTHDSGAGVVCSCIALARPIYAPAAETTLAVAI